MSIFAVVLQPRIVAAATSSNGIAISASPSAASAVQSSTTSCTVTLVRTAYTGTVSLAASGLPAGVTAAFSPSTLSGGTLASTLVFTIASGATVGAATITITASGAGVAPTEASFALTVTSSVAASIALNVTPGTLSVAKGYNTTCILTITRSGGFTGSVALSATSLPSGVAASFTPSVLTGSTLTSMVTLAAASGAATVSTAAIGFTASGSGVSPASVGATLTVTAAAAYEHLRPKTLAGDPLALPTGMTFNADTGDIDGTALDTTLPTFPATRTLTDTGNAVTNQSNLQALIDDVCAHMTQNTIIAIPASVAVAGSTALRVNSTGFWYMVEPLDASGLPAMSPGTVRGTKVNRVGPSHASLMPTFYPTAVNQPSFFTENGASHFILRGLNFVNTSAQDLAVAMIDVRPQSGVGTLSNHPTDYRIAQCLFDGNGPTSHVQRAVYMSGSRGAVIDCYIDHVGHSTASDTQAVLIASGPGTHKVNNNWSRVWGPSENILIAQGGSLPGTGATLLPRNIEIAGNYCTAPSGAAGSGVGDKKNDIEVKFGYNIAIIANQTNLHNGGGQQHSIVVKLTDQVGGSNPDPLPGNVATDTHDVTIMHNWVPRGPGGIVVSKAEYYGGTNVTRRVWVANNLCITDIEPSGAYGDAFALDGLDIQDVVFRFNTGIASQTKIYGRCVILLDSDSSRKMVRVGLDYNALVGIPDPNNWVVECGGHDLAGQVGEIAFDGCTTDGSCTGNLVSTYDNTRYSRQVRANDFNGMGFTNVSTADYSLTSSSPGYRAGPQGQDLGANMTLLMALQAGVI